MEFRVDNILKMVKRWWWLLLLGSLAPAVVSSSILAAQQRLYVATAAVMVGTTLQTPNPDPRAIEVSGRLAKLYSEMAARRPVLQAVIDRLGLDQTPDELAKQTRTSLEADALLIEIAFVDASPQRAAIIANAIAEELVKQSPSSGQSLQGQRDFILRQLEDLQLKIAETDDKISSITAQLSTLTSAAEIKEAQETLESLQKVLLTYQSTYASLLNSVGNTSNAVTVLEPALPPSEPISNRLSLIALLSGVLGLCLSSAGILVIEWLDAQAARRSSSQSWARVSSPPVSQPEAHAQKPN